MLIPPEHHAHFRSIGVKPGTLELHARTTPLDAHIDTMMASWLFGPDMKRNLRGVWKPTRNRFLYGLFKLLAPQGEHKPLFDHADIPRMIDGGFAGGCFAAHAVENNLHPSWGRPWRKISEQYAYLERLESEDPRCEIARTPDEFRAGLGEGKIVAIFAAEGAHCLGPVGKHTARRLHRLAGLRVGCGAAYITVNHFSTTDVATAGLPPIPGAKNDPNEPAGPLAEQFVETANRVGLVLDLAHTNRQGILDICRMSRKPVMATHAGAYAALQVRSQYDRRLLDVAAIEAIRDSGGCIGVMFSPMFLHGEDKDGSLDLVVRHYRELVNVAGHDHVCLGTDFDGALASIPRELRDAADLPLLTQRLLDEGWDESQIDALYSGNFLRVWAENDPAPASGDFPEDP